jgi:hypothetical protein
VCVLIGLILAPLLTSFYSLKNNYVISYTVEQFIQESSPVKNSMIEIDDITTYFSEEKHKVIIKIKAQE